MTSPLLGLRAVLHGGVTQDKVSTAELPIPELIIEVRYLRPAIS